MHCDCTYGVPGKPPPLAPTRAMLIFHVSNVGVDTTAREVDISHAQECSILKENYNNLLAGAST